MEAASAVPTLPGRILVVRLGAIGDVTNALVFASAIKHCSPNAHIGWAVHGLAAPLVKSHPHVDRVHLWNKGAGLGAFFKLLREIRGERYDLAVDLQRLQKSAWMARLSGAPRVLGFDRARAKEASWLLLKERIAPQPSERPMAEQYLEFAQHLKCAAPLKRFLPRDEAAERWADERVARLGGPPVVLNLGASKPANRWEPARFGRLAERLLAEAKVPVCLSGGPEDRPALAAALEAAPQSRQALDLVGQTSLLQLIALLRRARLFVGCDTGPMHLAAAVDCPVLALFGPADERRTGPYGPQHRVLRETPPCAPCNQKTCPLQRHACMLDLKLERVTQAVFDALGVAAGRHSS